MSEMASSCTASLSNPKLALHTRHSQVAVSKWSACGQNMSPRTHACMRVATAWGGATNACGTRPWHLGTREWTVANRPHGAAPDARRSHGDLGRRPPHRTGDTRTPQLDAHANKVPTQAWADSTRTWRGERGVVCVMQDVHEEDGQADAGAEDKERGASHLVLAERERVGADPCAAAVALGAARHCAAGPQGVEDEAEEAKGEEADAGHDHATPVAGEVGVVRRRVGERLPLVVLRT